MKLLLFITLALVIVVTINIEQSDAQWGTIIRNIGRRIGGSGKPVQHFRQLPNRKAAEDAARNAGKGNTPVRHTAHKPGQQPHYHPADKKGNIIKDGSHYSYPNRQG